jgi:hypothetical protein
VTLVAAAVFTATLLAKLRGGRFNSRRSAAVDRQLPKETRSRFSLHQPLSDGGDRSETNEVERETEMVPL